MQSRLNVAVIGVGRMGTVHARNLKKGRVKGARLSAICDIDVAALNKFTAKYGQIATFEDYKQLISDGSVQAVIIATPHYAHPDIAVYCIEHGVHVLVEKPLAVTTLDAKREIAAAEANKNVVAAVMFNQRTNPLYARAKRIIENGEIGKLQRVNYIITDWYRSQAYYNQGGWRASLWGEGGGTLINQCIHQLDLIQWVSGFPESVYVKMFTKGRNITVENDVTALFKYADDVYCSFSASTHELRGTNRMELSCEKGRIVIDKRKMTLYKFKRSEPEVNATTTFGYGFVTRKTSRYRYSFKFIKDLLYGQQINIVRNFVGAVRNGEELLSPIAAGLNAVEMINGMYTSGWTGEEVALPVDDEAYVKLLEMKKTEEAERLKGRNL